MASNNSEEMTWADLWDSNQDKPLPAEEKRKEEDCNKRKTPVPKKPHAGPFQWVKKTLWRKNSHK